MCVELVRNDYPIPAVGHSIKVPHQGCSGSNALRISNNPEGVHYYCFKCGLSVFDREDLSFLELKKRKAETAAVAREKSRRGYDLPTDFSHTIPAAGLAWLGQGGWDGKLIRRHDVGWSEQLGRVIIPLQPRGYIARAVHPGQHPKYLEKAPALSTWKSEVLTIVNSIVCVVEDVLSAGRVGEWIPCEALLGTAIGAWSPPKDIKRVVLWLDDDRAGVDARAALVRRLMWFPVEVFHIKTIKDPKSYSNTEMEAILTSCLKCTPQRSNS